jgi:hypothetical protein
VRISPEAERRVRGQRKIGLGQRKIGLGQRKIGLGQRRNWARSCNFRVAIAKIFYGA